MTAANPWTIVEIELLATAGWKCQPFSCPCSQNVTHCEKKRFVRHVKESVPAIPFWNTKHPLPARSRFLRAAVHPASSAFWLHRAHPFIAATGKNLSHAEKHWRRGFGHRVVVSKLCYNTVIVLSVVLCDCCKQMNNWLLRFSFYPQWVGNLAASLSAADVHNLARTAIRRFVRHVCLRNPFPLFLFGIPSIQSLPEATGSWEQQYALNYGCIMPMPSLQRKENTCLMQRSREIGHRVVVTVSKICYSTVIVPSVVLFDCCKPMNNSRDWAFRCF